ncbi:MAG TPA: cupin domain-containing protein [Vicinamibacterales bacterium]|nr:cupin domain-containing protein [Vicinamibacterales bacterium]
MTRYLLRDRRRTTAYLGILLAAAVTWTAGAQQPAPAGDQAAAGQAANFTGGKVTVLKPEGRLSWYVLGPGARTKWHTHEGGQLILAEEGRGRIQIRGQAVRELRPGESLWSPPGATHWHGAAPDSEAKLYQISRGQTTWLEEVRDTDYRSAPSTQ